VALSRYAHLDTDPLRRASDAIGGRIAAAMDGGSCGEIVESGEIVEIGSHLRVGR
jgi:hypothetical protein